MMALQLATATHCLTTNCCCHQFGREVLDIARDALRVGATGEDLDKAVFEACVERNVYPSPLNYYMFPKSLCVYVAYKPCCVAATACRRVCVPGLACLLTHPHLVSRTTGHGMRSSATASPMTSPLQMATL